MDIDQKALTPVKVPFRNKVFKIGYLKPFTTECVTRLMLQKDSSLAEDASEEDVLQTMSIKSKLMAQMASYIILNNFFKIKLLHPLFWRWLHYIKGYDYGQLFPIIAEGKKKIPVFQYAMGMALGAMMKETMKNLTRKEAEQFHQELMSAQGALSEKNTLGQ